MNFSNIPVSNVSALGTTIQPQEPAPMSELDCRCRELRENVDGIKNLLERVRCILTVPKPVNSSAGQPPVTQWAPTTIAEFLADINTDMAAVISFLTQLITALEAEVGELKILD